MLAPAYNVAKAAESIEITGCVRNSSDQPVGVRSSDRILRNFSALADHDREAALPQSPTRLSSRHRSIACARSIDVDDIPLFAGLGLCPMSYR
jgi:hypothetical protein